MKKLNCGVCSEEIPWEVTRKNPRQKYCSVNCYYKIRLGRSSKTNSKIILGENKLCPSCKEWKLLSVFYKRPDRPLGMRSKCKECEKKVQIGYRKTINRRLTNYRAGAKKRGLEWNMSIEEFAIHLR